MSPIASRTAEISRTIVLWCSDWPIYAAIATTDIPETTPIAVSNKSLVYACSPSARQNGVKRGQRLREAQNRCPDLTLLPHNSVQEIRVFEPVITALENLVPGVHVIRPGLCAMRARGPARYYGSEKSAARILHNCLTSNGVTAARVGIADGLFAAENAARSPEESTMTIIPPGGSAEFLAPLPLTLLGEPDLTSLLERVGIRVFGDLAKLTKEDMAARFGPQGVIAHTVACGLDSRTVIPRIPPRTLARALSFDPPLNRIEQAAFAFRTTADEFIAETTKATLVCTGIRIELTTEKQTTSRAWLHPRFFTASDIIDRLRWQLQGSGTSDTALEAPLTSIRIEPETVDDLAHHNQALWGAARDEKIHHGLSRVQSILGHESVLTAQASGGRNLADRQTFTPWGEKPEKTKPVETPWPGHFPPPHPATVFSSLQPVSVCEKDGDPIVIDERGTLSAEPTLFSPPPGDTRYLEKIDAWAGPWAVNERWWEPKKHTKTYRFHIIDSQGRAWLVRCDIEGETQSWLAEGRYD